MHRRFNILLLVIAMSFLIHPIWTSAEFTVNSKEFQSIIVQLDMQGHADDELSTCKVKQIYYEEVLEMLNKGMTEKEIIQSYVDEYGQAALREPARDKSGWVAWGMPFAGLASGMVVVGLWLRKVKSKEAGEWIEPDVSWQSEIEKNIAEQVFEEERRKRF